MCNIFKRLMGALISCIAIGFGSNASAVTIHFDDLVPIHDPVFPCFCDNPLSNEYASKGLIINDGYLDGESLDGGITYQNVLITGPYGQLSFTGELPTFVSMRVTSLHGDAIFLSAYGPDGFLATQQTPGFAGPFDDTPPEPNFYISFSAATGIQAINIDAFYFRSTGAAIDDLTFTYTSVPEPSSLLLLSFAGIMFVRRVLIKK